MLSMTGLDTELCYAECQIEAHKGFWSVLANKL